MGKKSYSFFFKKKKHKMNRKKGLDIIKFQIEMLEKKVPGIYHSDPIPIPKFEVDAGKVFCPYCSLPQNHFKVSLEEFRDHLKTEAHIKEFCKFHLLPSLANEMTFALREKND